MTSPKCPLCGENHPTDESRKTLAEWYEMFERNGGDLMSESAIARLKSWNSAPDPVASARLEDGSLVVAYEPSGLEVRAFGVEGAIRVVDLDDRVLPKVKS